MTGNYTEPFFGKEEFELTKEFLDKGYIIRPVNDKAKLDGIRDTIVQLACEHLGQAVPKDKNGFLNDIHTHLTVEKLNDLRLKIFNGFNALPEARSNYFSLAQAELETIVGNELAMQKRVNLSIQLPNDDSSLLPVHSDVWAGDSPYEVVEWLPLVDCYKTKSMFILPPKVDAEFNKRFDEFAKKSTEDLYKAIEPHVTWLEVPYGSVLTFAHTLMHGNRVNREPETRWSMNCRFKSLLSPYWDKRLGEFFEPIKVRAATRIGMDYKLPGKFSE